MPKKSFGFMECYYTRNIYQAFDNGTFPRIEVRIVEHEFDLKTDIDLYIDRLW